MTQLALLPELEEPVELLGRDTSTTFQDNLTLPVHRWFRYSAGFSASWVGSVLHDLGLDHQHVVLDPFAGAGTTIIECEFQGVRAIGLDPHPFVSRIARAKLQWRSAPADFLRHATEVLCRAESSTADPAAYPDLIQKCYTPESLRDLDRLRGAVAEADRGDAASRLTWLNLASIIRATSTAGTAQWQYVLPKKSKKRVLRPFDAFRQATAMIRGDMELMQARRAQPEAQFSEDDARTCSTVADGSVDCVITSPPYPNNFDYADATRLEMSFLREIQGWGDLHAKVRSHLVRSCSQHVPPKSVDLDAVLASPELALIRAPLTEVCRKLSELRLTRGGKKTYNNMIACYYLDMAKTWQALRRVCKTGARVCFVIGDSAPYGVHAPAVEWMGALALAAGFETWRFEKTRDRNVKWKNRKHRVPLLEGRLWVQG